MRHAVPAEPRYVSLARASAMVDVCTRTLRRVIAARRLTAHHVGRLIRIDLAELQRWVEADGAAGLPRERAGRRAA
jgi:excisionase family DNA binding protein